MRLSKGIDAYSVKFSKKGKGKSFPDNLLALYNFHGRSGNGLRLGSGLLLLLAGNESSGGKSEDSDLLHNIILVLVTLTYEGNLTVLVDSSNFIVVT